MSTDKKIFVFEILAQINRLIISATEITPETINDFNENLNDLLREYLTAYKLVYNNLSIFYMDTEIFKIEAIECRPALKFVNSHPEIAESNNLHCYKLLISLKINDNSINHINDHIETAKFNLAKLNEKLAKYKIARSNIIDKITD